MPIADHVVSFPAFDSAQAFWGILPGVSSIPRVGLSLDEDVRAVYSLVLSLLGCLLYIPSQSAESLFDKSRLTKCSVGKVVDLTISVRSRLRKTKSSQKASPGKVISHLLSHPFHLPHLFFFFCCPSYIYNI